MESTILQLSFSLVCQDLKEAAVEYEEISSGKGSSQVVAQLIGGSSCVSELHLCKLCLLYLSYRHFLVTGHSY